jgi:hypothetical protein
MGGAESLGAMAADTMRLTADDVQTPVIPGVGHWLAEQAPEQLTAALTEFLAAYHSWRDIPSSPSRPAIPTAPTRPACTCRRSG